MSGWHISHSRRRADAGGRETSQDTDGLQGAKDIFRRGRRVRNRPQNPPRPVVFIYVEDLHAMPAGPTSLKGAVRTLTYVGCFPRLQTHLGRGKG
ncbi:MAG: hypothetical protein JWQ56_3550 [Pseudarthrobacter sp.]|nr:hypothetical protein [Pseudarthrobacter sp.]